MARSPDHGHGVSMEAMTVPPWVLWPILILLLLMLGGAFYIVVTPGK